MTGHSTSLADVLIVIPCLNEVRALPDLLASLIAEAPDARIVVADGGSTDGSRDLVRAFARDRPAVTLLDNPDRIQAAGINRAVERFGGGHRWLVRMDAHCLYPRGYVAGLVRTAVRVGAQSVTVPMRTVGTGLFQRAVACAQNSILGTGGSAHRTGTRGGFVDHGHHALMEIAAYRRAGGYCEQMTHNEDAELDIRLIRSRARIWLEPDLSIDYLPRRTPTALFRQYLRYGMGRARTVLRHRIPPKLRQMVPMTILPVVAIAPLGLWWWGAALPVAAWLGSCLAWGGAMAVRRREPAMVLTGPAAIIMHFAWSLGFWAELSSTTKQRPNWRAALRFHIA